MQSITIEAPTQTEGTISIQSVPYSSLSGAFANNGDTVSIYTDDLWTAVAELSSVAIAMDAIFTATTDLRDWAAARLP